MGSPKLFDTKPQTPMAELTDKKSIKNILKKPFIAIFQRGDKKKRKNDIEKFNTRDIVKEPSITPILNLIENLTIGETDAKTSLNIQREINDNFEFKDVDDKTDDEKNNLEPTDLPSNATYNIENKTGRSDSKSSNDSGYSEKNSTDKESIDEVVEGLVGLRVDAKSKDEKKTKIQKVFISRGPIKTKQGTSDYHPYQQINQVNKQTFSGGQVIVKAAEIPERIWPDVPHEIDLAISQVNLEVNDFTKNSKQEQIDRWNIAQEFVIEKQEDNELENFVFRTIEDNQISDFVEIPHTNFEVDNFVAPKIHIDTIEEFNEKEYYNKDIEDRSITSLEDLLAFNLTPPRSNENRHASPILVPSSKNYYCTPPYTSSVSSCTYNSPTSDYILSPERSSPNDFRIDYENYQELPVFDDQSLPSCLDKLPKEPKKVQRSSTITMRAVKDILKRLNMEFTKSQCCQKNEDSKIFFQKHFEKFSVDERKTLCLRVTNMELNKTYEVLENILLSLGSSSEKENLYYALFSLVCERVLVQEPARFLGDYGLNLLKLAALRCPSKPALVRHLIRCVRRALSTDEGKKCKAPLYNEVDALGDNLVGACARAGDVTADVLAELVRCEDDDIPLFEVAHRNIEGCTPLHLACLQDGAGGAGGRWLRTVHVLLVHARLDLTDGDTKGGDTALHLAVNSRRPTLELVLALMAHAPRQQWKQLAHATNRSSMTPLEYARSATKSQTNYPIEVLDFLKKCR